MLAHFMALWSAMKQRTYIRPPSPADIDRIAMFCTANPAPGARVRNLSELAAGGCLFAATQAGRLAGVVGLDLGRRAMAGPWIRPQAAGPDLGRRMVVAAERLAARYGMTHLIVYPAENATAFFADNGYLKVAGGLGATSARPGMARSIVRRSTRFARRVREVSEALGIPRDYGARHQLRLQPESRALRSIGKDIYGREQKMAPRAAAAWTKMSAAARAEGIAILPVSAFRTVDYQEGLIRAKLEKGHQLEHILAVSAAPGYSEHHSGRAIDVTTPGCEVLEEPFEDTGAFKWLTENAGDFGFALSYPRNNRHGVAYEPWHWMHH